MKEKILVLGATGMLGSSLFRRLMFGGYEVVGTERYNTSPLLRGNVDALQFDTVERAIEEEGPAAVVNCVGVIRQRPDGQDPLVCIPLNSLFPYLLFRACHRREIRLIHFSTDCVFSGKKLSPYEETDPSDATDMYGRSKFLGEVNEKGALTIRTSIIGHELRGKLSLVEWFLRQEGVVKGFSKAIYSGLPTVEISNILVHHILPNRSLSGLYQVSAEPISKYELLKLIAKIYGLKVDLEPNDTVVENKVLNSSRFRKETGWQPPAWDRLIQDMHNDFRESIRAQ